jgi:hypothetical protein
VEANVCIYANATILEAILSSVKTVLLVEIHGLPNHSGRFACHKYHNNRSKNKRTKIAWSLKIIRPYRNTPLVESVNLIKNKNIKLLLKLEGNNPGGSQKIVLPTT